jgi:two-component system NtrC family sensor kinase
MPSVKVTQTFAPLAVPGPVSPDAIVSAHALYVADEALSSVRHDVLNRMTAVGALGFEIRRSLGPSDEVRGRLEDLNRQVAMVCQTVARRLAPIPPEAPPGCTLRDLMEPLSFLCAGSVELQTSNTRVRVACEPVPLAVALLCLLQNATEASAEAQRPLVEVAWQSEPGDRVAVEVIDNGDGLTPEVQARAFERFFSTRAGRAGLGLCVALTLIRRAGGEIDLERRPAGQPGTRVRIRLPASTRRARGEGR